jgi:hypothetical protein
MHGNMTGTGPPHTGSMTDARPVKVLSRRARRLLRFRMDADINRSTRAGRRVSELERRFAEALGFGDFATAPFEAQLAISRAAVLTALSENVRSRALAGDTAVPLDDIVRIDRLASQARKEFGKLQLAKEPGSTPSLADIIGEGIE